MAPQTSSSSSYLTKVISQDVHEKEFDGFPKMTSSSLKKLFNKNLSGSGWGKEHLLRLRTYIQDSSGLTQLKDSDVPKAIRDFINLKDEDIRCMDERKLFDKYKSESISTIATLLGRLTANASAAGSSGASGSAGAGGRYGLRPRDSNTGNAPSDTESRSSGEYPSSMDTGESQETGTSDGDFIEVQASAKRIPLERITVELLSACMRLCLLYMPKQEGISSTLQWDSGEQKFEAELGGLKYTSIDDGGLIIRQAGVTLEEENWGDSRILSVEAKRSATTSDGAGGLNMQDKWLAQIVSEALAARKCSDPPTQVVNNQSLRVIAVSGTHAIFLEVEISQDYLTQLETALKSSIAKPPGFTKYLTVRKGKWMDLSTADGRRRLYRSLYDLWNEVLEEDSPEDSEEDSDEDSDESDDSSE